MSFVESSREMWLEDGHILHALCQDDDGNWNGASIDLDRFIGNSDGWFVWDGENFSHSASDISLDGTLLSAEMGMVDGGNRERQGLDLNERIGNSNGELVYKG
ncbi:Cyanovirin-N [Metarhizium album ARSEF 1941]|uniref:Cyanovirin-N n=1 Tax=Metarhizium album (strain ARSEF 1941) TaxID=1081103 RepID=A0A0B2WKP9_METAS|nr:Cyanovirin-N [Metarhizium album ARSEF 1941]KHN94518.1 Cyanovirin-N [Metarhizium album ARSEF 1941]